MEEMSPSRLRNGKIYNNANASYHGRANCHATRNLSSTNMDRDVNTKLLRSGKTYPACQTKCRASIEPRGLKRSRSSICRDNSVLHKRLRSGKLHGTEENEDMSKENLDFAPKKKTQNLNGHANDHPTSQIEFRDHIEQGVLKRILSLIKINNRNHTEQLGSGRNHAAVNPDLAKNKIDLLQINQTNKSQYLQDRASDRGTCRTKCRDNIDQKGQKRTLSSTRTEYYFSPKRLRSGKIYGHEGTLNNLDVSKSVASSEIVFTEFSDIIAALSEESSNIELKYTKNNLVDTVQSPVVIDECSLPSELSNSNLINKNTSSSVSSRKIAPKQVKSVIRDNLPTGGILEMFGQSSCSDKMCNVSDNIVMSNYCSKGVSSSNICGSSSTQCTDQQNNLIVETTKKEQQSVKFDNPTNTSAQTIHNSNLPSDLPLPLSLKSNQMIEKQSNSNLHKKCHQQVRFCTAPDKSSIRRLAGKHRDGSFFLINTLDYIGSYLKTFDMDENDVRIYDLDDPSQTCLYPPNSTINFEDDIESTSATNKHGSNDMNPTGELDGKSFSSLNDEIIQTTENSTRRFINSGNPANTSDLRSNLPVQLPQKKKPKVILERSNQSDEECVKHSAKSDKRSHKSDNRHFKSGRTGITNKGYNASPTHVELLSVKGSKPSKTSSRPNNPSSKSDQVFSESDDSSCETDSDFMETMLGFYEMLDESDENEESFPSTFTSQEKYWDDLYNLPCTSSGQPSSSQINKWDILHNQPSTSYCNARTSVTNRLGSNYMKPTGELHGKNFVPHTAKIIQTTQNPTQLFINSGKPNTSYSPGIIPMQHPQKKKETVFPEESHQSCRESVQHSDKSDNLSRNADNLNMKSDRTSVTNKCYKANPSLVELLSVRGSKPSKATSSRPNNPSAKSGLVVSESDDSSCESDFDFMETMLGFYKMLDESDNSNAE